MGSIIDELLRMINAEMRKLRDVQSIVGGMTICIDDAVGRYFLADNRD